MRRRLPSDHLLLIGRRIGSSIPPCLSDDRLGLVNGGFGSTHAAIAGDVDGTIGRRNQYDRNCTNAADQ